MSARVFNPSAVMELRRAVRGGLPPAEPASVPAPVVEHVRRSLFGPVDHEENRRFVQRQLEDIAVKEMEFYGFNFREEKPLDGSPRRFAWSRVSPGSVPKSYALSRLAYLRGAPAEAEQLHHQQQQLQQQEMLLIQQQARQQQEKQPAQREQQQENAAPATKTEAASKPGPSTQPPCTPASSRMRQKRIEDFMPTRKRAGAYTPSTVKTKTATTTSSTSTECGGGSDAKQRKFSAATV